MLKSALIIRLSEAEVNSLMAHSGKLYIQGRFFKDWNNSQDCSRTSQKQVSDWTMATRGSNNDGILHGL
jgi:hypothetical protein